MEDFKTLFDQIEVFELKSQRDKAQFLREKILQIAEFAQDEEYLFIADKLIKEKAAINGVEEANQVESYYYRLQETARIRIGCNHGLTALAKRNLARIYVIQGRYQDAISIVETALPVMAAQFGNDSFEVREAMNSQIEWCKWFDSAKAKALIEKEWLEHPLCNHLKPIEDYLQAKGVPMWREEGNTRPSVRIFVRACLDVDSIRRRLNLDICVEDFEDSPAPHSWYLKGFACKIHQHFIAGDYEQDKSRQMAS